ncbi:MAG: rhodanese-like domain-containing protein [Bdellovibrio sp.]|nr:MAG: rhodanese-like domain-containing protein [Bdellovibrio sp.]
MLRFMGLLVLVVGFVISGGCKKEAPKTKTVLKGSEFSASQGLPDRDPQLAKKLVEEQGALLLDVRTPGEYERGHIKGAKLLPIQDFERQIQKIEEWTKGDKSKPIVVYCQSGGRAARAKEILLKYGYKKVTNLGGYQDWPSN